MEQRIKNCMLTTISLLATLGLAGCASDSGKVNGAGGAEPTGGASNMGGASDSGGTSGGGNAGTTGGSASQDCTASITTTAPTNGLIADFASVDGGIDITGGVLFAFPRGEAAAPAFVTSGGVLQIKENASAASMSQYVGIILAFNGCIDASAFSGVQFSISGTSLMDCTMQYATIDVGHRDATAGFRFATGPAGAFPPQATITQAQITSTPLTLLMPFVNGPSGGSPATPVDRAKLIGVLWQFTIAPGVDGGAACIADITIDNVSFY